MMYNPLNFCYNEASGEVLTFRVMIRVRVISLGPRVRVRVKSPQINDSCIPYSIAFTSQQPGIPALLVLKLH